MTMPNNFPSASYGILQQTQPGNSLDEAVEQVKNLGYAILDSGLTAPELKRFSEEFDRTFEDYVKTYGEARLRTANEYHTIRSPLTHGSELFLKLALNENLLAALKKLIAGKFILNQQNGIINPPQETYNQSAWHRDLPYQHFVSTRPIAINALFCVDDFTRDNGATYVLPASHKVEAFPTSSYVQKNAIQVEAKAGSFLLLDCMVFHAGGYNTTNARRRAVNHLYNIPYFRQQINIPMNIKNQMLSAETRSLLGFDEVESDSIEKYLSIRASKIS